MFRLCLTVVAVLVDLRVRVDLHRGTACHLRDPAFQGGAHCQVVVLIDAFELLPDGQLLIPWQKGHLCLACELSPYRRQTTRGGHFKTLALDELWLPAFCLI